MDAVDRLNSMLGLLNKGRTFSELQEAAGKPYVDPGKASRKDRVVLACMGERAQSTDRVDDVDVELWAAAI